MASSANDEPTTRMSVVSRPEPDLPRWVLPALAVAYGAVGAVLAFACLVLAHAADEITNSPLCRRI